MSDPWMQHLEKYDLLELHNEAQKVGYRIRVANGWTFDLEYEGGLAKFYERGNAIKTFEDDEQGRAKAREFLSTVSFHQELAEVSDRVSKQHHLSCDCDECTTHDPDCPCDDCTGAITDDDSSSIPYSSADDSLDLPDEYDADGRKLNKFEGIGGYHNQIGGYSCPNCHDFGCYQCQSWDQLCM